MKSAGFRNTFESQLADLMGNGNLLTMHLLIEEAPVANRKCALLIVV
jgi:hypothetical protein